MTTFHFRSIIKINSTSDLLVKFNATKKSKSYDSNYQQAFNSIAFLCHPLSTNHIILAAAIDMADLDYHYYSTTYFPKNTTPSLNRLNLVLTLSLIDSILY